MRTLLKKKLKKIAIKKKKGWGVLSCDNGLLRPVQLGLGLAERHHPERQLDVLQLGHFCHLAFIQARVEHHGGVAHRLLVVHVEQLPARKFGETCSSCMRLFGIDVFDIIL